MKTNLTKDQLKNLKYEIKFSNYDIDDYDYDQEIEMEFNTENCVLVATVDVLANTYTDTSDLDYYTGTGYSSELLKNGFFEAKDLNVFDLSGEEINITQEDENILMEEINTL